MLDHILILCSLALLMEIEGIEICYDKEKKALGYCPLEWHCCPDTSFCCHKDTVCFTDTVLRCQKPVNITNMILIPVYVAVLFLIIFGFKRWKEPICKKLQDMKAKLHLYWRDLNG